MFESIFENGNVTTETFFISIACALGAGIIFALICRFSSKSSKSFYIATALLPMVVAMVIALVNGNIGVGVAIAGAFSLVRFRSAQGSAKEICIIFISMASGLAFGTGYIAYGVIFVIISAIAMFTFDKIPLLEQSNKERTLKITIPESLNYTTVFDSTFKKYLAKYEIQKVKTTNMGSLFVITYSIKLKNQTQEKELIDDLRVLNGNLEILIERPRLNDNEL